MKLCRKHNLQPGVGEGAGARERGFAPLGLLGAVITACREGSSA